MKRINLFLATVLVAATTAAVPANAAVTVRLLAAGSSAMWQLMGVAAFNDLAGAGAHHYTIKGSCTAGNCAFLHEQRGGGTIPDEGGSLWVVWDSAQTQVWAYLTVDSIVGNRTFFANPRPLLQLDPDVNNGTKPGANLIDANLFNGGTADDAKIPNAIYLAITGTPIKEGMTDIRPEDAKFGQVRIVNPLNTTNYNGLGYGTGANTLVGTQIKSEFSSSVATPVAFNIKGKDPFSGNNIAQTYVVTPVGASPIIFLINRTNPAGLGQAGLFKNGKRQDLLKIFDGDNCNSGAFTGVAGNPKVPVFPILREPLSGTMNTTEFTMFRVYTTTAAPKTTQEKHVNPAADNPLNQTCFGTTSTQGLRRRVIGTGEEVNTGVKNNADAIGYTFFSYGNVSQLAGTPSYGYLQVDSVDPLNASYTDGNLPTCIAPAFCGVGPNTSFPHLRDGTYRAWSVIRMLSDASDVDGPALASEAQNDINLKVPDFVPFNATSDGDLGLQLVRSHYLQSGIAPQNASPEKGGDVGGCILVKGDTTTNKHQGGVLGGSCFP